MLRQKPLEKYKKQKINSTSNRIGTYFFKYVSSITLVLRKKESNSK